METEVCAYSLTTCKLAAKAGATRVELCASYTEGGISPSAGLIRLVRQIKNIELSVMVRPRGGDFVYSEDEFSQMMADIGYLKEVGADGVVIGLLNTDGTVDVERTRKLVEWAAPMEVTFHRAFDMANDWGRALEDVISTGCKRILTSGGQQTAEKGLDVIRQLVKQANGRIEIMAGSGVNPSNAAHIASVGIDAIHFSAGKILESPMQYRHIQVALSSSPEQDYKLQQADYDIIQQIVGIIRSL